MGGTAEEAVGLTGEGALINCLFAGFFLGLRKSNSSSSSSPAASSSDEVISSNFRRFLPCPFAPPTRVRGESAPRTGEEAGIERYAAAAAGGSASASAREEGSTSIPPWAEEASTAAGERGGGGKGERRF
jgi:hypothetical protein